MWLCSHVQLLPPALIDDEPRSSMSTSGRTALPPRHVGLYRTGPPPSRGGWIRPLTRCIGVGLRFVVIVTLGWVALALFVVVALGWVALVVSFTTPTSCCLCRCGLSYAWVAFTSRRVKWCWWRYGWLVLCGLKGH